MTPHPHPIHPLWCLKLARQGKVESVAARQYLKRRSNKSSIHLPSNQLFIILKKATIVGDFMEEITIEVDLFGSIMQQNVIENEFNREYAFLATIQPGAAIEFRVTGLNDLYLDLNNSRLHVLANITYADGSNIDTNTAVPINLNLHSMFSEIGVELNGQNVGDNSQLYPYRLFV